jgi:hypothetical protein
MKILTSVVNNVDFIEIQYFTFKKYFKGEYEFIVFNDAKEFPDITNGGDISIKNKIKMLCEKLNIKCINVENTHHKEIDGIDMGRRHADTFCKYILPYQKNNPDKYLVIDSDMFLVDKFDIEKYSKYECAIVLQSRNINEIVVNYLWTGLCYLDFTRIQDIDIFDWNVCDGFDSGGMTQFWFKKHMKNNIIPTTYDIRWTDGIFHTENTYFIKHLWSCSWDESEIPENLKNNLALIDFIKDDCRNQNSKFFCEIYDNVFLHYRAGSNWLSEGLDLHNSLTQKLKHILM